MGDTGASSRDGKFNFLKWWKGGSDKGKSPSTPQPAGSEDDEEDDEPENNEAVQYGLEDPRKPKNVSQGSRTHQAGPSRDKDRATDASLGGSSTTKLCAGCKLNIGQGSSQEFAGALFHPQCLTCSTCGQPVANHESSLSESGRPQHKSCYEESRPLTCDICRRFLPLNKFGPIEYRYSPFWSQRYCKRHDFDNTPRCCSCTRLQSWHATYVSLGDGRILCLECKESAIMDIGICQPLYRAVREFMEGMQIWLNHPVSVHIVDQQTINLARSDDGKPPRHLPRCYTPVLGPEIVVLLLYGYPSLELGAWIAKELTREWLYSNGYDHLHIDLEVSICSLVAYLWLESVVKSTASSFQKGRNWEVERKFSNFCMYRIANKTYGARCGAFQATKTAVDKYGLHPTIKYIDATGYLPW